MMIDYNKYLAASLFTEQKIAPLSRLGNPCQFSQRNIRKPGSIHAVYIVSGVRADEAATDISKGNTGEFEENNIQSSASTNSQASIQDEGARKSSVETIALVREQDLKETKSRYEKINSIHVYSIGPYLVKDLQILSDVSRELRERDSGEDYLKTCSVYGIIQNKNVKCRNGSRPLPIVQKSSTKPIATPSKSFSNDDKSVATAKRKLKATELTTSDGSHDKIKTKDVPIGTINSRNEIRANPIQPSKHDSSSIFNAFAKAESKPKSKPKQNPTDDILVEKGISNMDNDSPMKNVSSDDEESWIPAPGQTEKTYSNIESMEKREMALRKMMDDDYEEEKEEVGDEIATSRNPSKLNEQSKLKEACVKIEDQTKVASDAKKRSRRRVMKKSTFKDDEGYLVTKEELAWESFSEDERNSKPRLKAQLLTANSKPKKGNTVKSGQGNIMSFFGKKQS